MENWKSACAAEVPGKLRVHSPNLAHLKFSVKVVRHKVRLWKAVENSRPGERPQGLVKLDHFLAARLICRQATG
jgi:hypothetical protein